jgi:hypothetical protein
MLNPFTTIKASEFSGLSDEKPNKGVISISVDGSRCFSYSNIHRLLPSEGNKFVLAGCTHFANNYNYSYLRFSSYNNILVYSIIQLLLMKINMLLSMNCSFLLALCCVLPMSMAFVSPQSQTTKTLRAAGVELHSVRTAVRIPKLGREVSNYADVYERARLRTAQASVPVAVPTWLSEPMELYNPKSINEYNPSSRPVAASVSVPSERTRTERNLSQMIQGDHRETWALNTGRHSVHEQVVSLQTNGRPLHADLELWDGPNNVPQKIRLWSEDGQAFPFTSMLTNPGGVLSIRNTGSLAFPLTAGVRAGAPLVVAPSFLDQYYEGRPAHGPDQSRFSSFSYDNFSRTAAAASAVPMGKTIQGEGSLNTFTVHPSVKSVRITAQSYGTPIMSVIELWQGPGAAKQTAQVYSQDGQNRPFSAVLETPGNGCVIAIRNVGNMAFPMAATVEPYEGGELYNRNDYRESDYSKIYNNIQNKWGHSDHILKENLRGDFGRTFHSNQNAYIQEEELSWEEEFSKKEEAFRHSGIW